METQITTPRGPVTIRPPTMADTQAYRSLRLEALSNSPTSFSADYAFNEAQPLTYWESRLRALGSESMFYFAAQNESFTGMCGVVRGNSPKTKHSASIISVYVQPDWRGLHIAEGLIEQCAEWARAHEIKILKLAVVTTNTGAIRCYARSGFTVYGIEPQAILYQGVMYDELMMARILAS